MGTSSAPHHSHFWAFRRLIIVNDTADFIGENGCFLYQGRDVAVRKQKQLNDQILVIAPLDGLVSPNVWLQCLKKLMNNTTFQHGRKAQNTWLVGKIKCRRYGYALVSVNSLGIQQSIHTQMVTKKAEFQTITGGDPAKVNPKLFA